MVGSGSQRGEAARPRVLLRRISEALARPGDGQQRLDQIVRLIAVNMVAEVCSIYLLNAENDLELSASEGLNAASVHTARLALGEGLVGRIAQTGAPINTDDAQNTPGFQYIPSTGEEVYKSFLGAPIRRQGHTRGVLVVQNRKPRRYDEDEVDALELIATVIAEMADAGALIDERIPSPAPAPGPKLLEGATAAEGVAMGRVVLHEPKIVLANPIAEDIEAERARLHQAMTALRGEVDRLIALGAEAIGPSAGGAPAEHHDVLEAYRMFAHDGGWLRRLDTAVASGLAAEAAVERVQSETRARMERTQDPYLRERLSDLDDLANRLLRQLFGVAPPAPEDLPEDAILVARTLGPGEVLDYGRAGLSGVAMEEGSAASHAAIVARAFDIPLVTTVKGLLHAAEAEDPIVVDGDLGRVMLRPEPAVATGYREKLTLRANEQAAFRALRAEPTVTQDGVRLSLQMNAGLLTDMPSIDASGAEGVGLYRTELQYLINDRAPGKDRQTALYRRVFEAAGDHRVVFRTLDMGGDKRLPFLKGAAEENPALGWRAIRIALDRPKLFSLQLKALVRAAEGRPLWVMFPMVATAAEFDAARALLLEVRDREARLGAAPPSDVKIGAMLETPALAFAPDRFFEQADFISVGGNDLAQFFFAADRGNERVRRRYDALDGSYLRLLRQIVRRCAAAGAPLSFCGEMAGRPAEALALAAIGFRTLSMRPVAIGPAKRALRSVALGPLAAAVEGALDSGDDGGKADGKDSVRAIVEAALAGAAAGPAGKVAE